MKYPQCIAIAGDIHTATGVLRFQSRGELFVAVVLLARGWQVTRGAELPYTDAAGNPHTWFVDFAVRPPNGSWEQWEIKSESTLAAVAEVELSRFNRTNVHEKFAAHPHVKLIDGSDYAKWESPFNQIMQTAAAPRITYLQDQTHAERAERLAENARQQARKQLTNATPEWYARRNEQARQRYRKRMQEDPESVRAENRRKSKSPGFRAGRKRYYEQNRERILKYHREYKKRKRLEKSASHSANDGAR